MSRELKQQHPTLMVPHVITMAVVVYTNGGPPTLDIGGMRDALVAALPPGTGVGSLHLTHHGVYGTPTHAELLKALHKARTSPQWEHVAINIRAPLEDMITKLEAPCPPQ